MATYIDVLLQRGQEQRDERRRAAERLLLPRGRGIDFESQVAEMEEIEAEEKLQAHRIANFGKLAFIPVGKTQRSLDESEDEAPDDAVPTEPAPTGSPGGDPHMDFSEEHEPDEDGGGESEGDGELMGGDLDASIEDMDASIEDMDASLEEADDDGEGESELLSEFGGQDASGTSGGLEGVSVEMQEGPSWSSEHANMST